MIRVSFSDKKGEVTGGILLAEYERRVSGSTTNTNLNDAKDAIDKKHRFFLVYAPKKPEKERLVEVNENDTILRTLNLEPEWIRVDNFESRFKKDRPNYRDFSPIEIFKYEGYPFIVENDDFLINVIYNFDDYAKGILYREMPELSNE